MKQENIDGVKGLLDRWANWVGVGGSMCDGAPRQSPVAPDARIQSIEDWEIADQKTIVNAVDTAVWELPKPQRDVVMMYYGFSHVAWKPGDDGIFELCLVNLYHLLKERLTVCK